MSPYQIVQCAAVATLAAFILMEVILLVTRTKHEGRILIAESVFGIFAGALLLVWGITWSRYDSYGAFYDDSWRDPDVENHFFVKNDDTEALQKIYDSEGESFDFDAHNVVLIRLGCEDCENAMTAIQKLDEDPDYYIVFSRSEIGKAYVDHYHADYVPTAVVNGVPVEMRPSVNTASPDEDIGAMMDEIIDSEFGKSDPSKPGTAEAAKNAWEAEHDTESESESETPID